MSDVRAALIAYYTEVCEADLDLAERIANDIMSIGNGERVLEHHRWTAANPHLLVED